MSRPNAKKARPSGAKTSASTHPLVPAFRSLDIPFILEAGRPELIRLDRACKHGNIVIVGVCPRSVRNFTARKLLPVIRLGRRRLYRRDAVLAALKEL